MTPRRAPGMSGISDAALLQRSVTWRGVARCTQYDRDSRSRRQLEVEVLRTEREKCKYRCEITMRSEDAEFEKEIS